MILAHGCNITKCEKVKGLEYFLNALYIIFLHAHTHTNTNIYAYNFTYSHSYKHIHTTLHTHTHTNTHIHFTRTGDVFIWGSGGIFNVGKTYR